MTETQASEQPPRDRRPIFLWIVIAFAVVVIFGYLAYLSHTPSPQNAPMPAPVSTGTSNPYTVNPYAGPITPNTNAPNTSGGTLPEGNVSGNALTGTSKTAPDNTSNNGH